VTGVAELVADRVGVAAERVEGCLLDTCGELVRLRLQRPPVGGAGPAEARVEKPRACRHLSW
jgi:hypothetical protein